MKDKTTKEVPSWCIISPTYPVVRKNVYLEYPFDFFWRVLLQRMRRHYSCIIDEHSHISYFSLYFFRCFQHVFTIWHITAKNSMKSNFSAGQISFWILHISIGFGIAQISYFVNCSIVVFGAYVPTNYSGPFWSIFEGQFPSYTMSCTGYLQYYIE